MSTRIGLWLPIFGAWLRNVPDEGMDWTFDYNKQVAQAADDHDFETLLVAELKRQHPQVSFELRPAIGEDARVVDMLARIALATS